MLRLRAERADNIVDSLGTTDLLDLESEGLKALTFDGRVNVGSPMKGNIPAD